MPKPPVAVVLDAESCRLSADSHGQVSGPSPGRVRALSCRLASHAIPCERPGRQVSGPSRGRVRAVHAIQSATARHISAARRCSRRRKSPPIAASLRAVHQREFRAV